MSSEAGHTCATAEIRSSSLFVSIGALNRSEVSVKSRIIAGTIGCLGLVGGTASAAPVFVDQDKGISVNLGVLLQPQFQITAAGSEGQGSTGIGAPDGKSPSFDFS